MADQNELVIKISGDVGDYKAALDLASEQTEDLASGLKTVAIAAGVAFAALSVEVYKSVAAFNEHVVASNELTNALQNQGMYSTELVGKYREMAEAISAKTGVDADAITSAQAGAQALLGQKEITTELTKAVLDFATVQKLDLDSAFKIVAKSVNGNVNMLQRYGVELGGAVTSTEKLTKITEVLGQKYDGAAEQAANASGNTSKLKVAFDEMQKAIGERLAPTFDLIVGGLTKFFSFVTQHGEIANFAGDVILAGTALSGLALVATVGATAFLQLRAAVIAAGLAAEAASIGFKALVGATGIGLVIIAVAELYQHWAVIWPAMQAIFYTFVDNFRSVAAGLGTIIAGIFLRSPSVIKAGLDEIVAAYRTAAEKVAAIKSPEVFGPPSSAFAAATKAAKDKLANEEQAIRDRYDAIAVAKRTATAQLLQLQDTHASKDTIELKKQEVQILTEMEDRKNQALLGSLQKRLNSVRKLEADQAIVEKERGKILNDELLKNDDAYQAMSTQEREIFLQRNKQMLLDDLVTEHNAKEAWAKKDLELEKKNHNTFLLEQQKYGTAYAAINKAMHSAVYEGTKSAFGSMADLQNSSNSTLKAIGKEAAVANIIISTAEAAMNIYKGFSTIPIVGPALGVAGAAAAVAYGAEQVVAVQSAAQGGLLEGGIPGVDSIPVLAMAGEVVAPRQNFEEVVGSVAASRAAKESGLMPGGGGSDSPQMLSVLQSIHQALTSKGAAGGTNVVIHGDALGDQVWVDQMVRKIGEALEFKHARIPGINVALS